MEVDAPGLCAIIKACHKAGVTCLKFGDVEVNFGSDHIVNNVSRETPARHVEPVLQSGQVSMELSADQKAIMEEAENTELMISNPERWEESEIDRLVYRDRALDEHRRVE